jgi:phosphoadenosine phosphosulfate reductase
LKSEIRNPEFKNRTMKELDAIRTKIGEYREAGLKLFMTSSFQSHSIPLLHIISRIDNHIPVFFLDTGYHFPETLAFRDKVSKMLNLNLKIVRSHLPKAQQKDSSGRLLFTSNIDYCCYLNKVQPMEPIINTHDVWVSGVRADQNSNRAQMEKEIRTASGKMRYHPILEWTSKMIHEYALEYDLPRHPLEEKGYFSIGCEPCTQSILEQSEDRGGRWAGMKKTECGLHTDLVKK